MKDKYKIKPSLHEEAMEAWVWLCCDNNKDNGYLTITNGDNGKKITIYKRTIDKYFIYLYNNRPLIKNTEKEITEEQFTLVIGEYYRKKLDIKTSEKIELDIRESTWFEKYKTLFSMSPNPTVQLANRIALFSLSLGIISLIISVIFGIISTVSLIVGIISINNF